MESFLRIALFQSGNKMFRKSVFYPVTRVSRRKKNFISPFGSVLGAGTLPRRDPLAPVRFLCMSHGQRLSLTGSGGEEEGGMTMIGLVPCLGQHGYGEVTFMFTIPFYCLFHPNH